MIWMREWRQNWPVSEFNWHTLWLTVMNTYLIPKTEWNWISIYLIKLEKDINETIIESILKFKKKWVPIWNVCFNLLNLIRMTDNQLKAIDIWPWIESTASWTTSLTDYAKPCIKRIMFGKNLSLILFTSFILKENFAFLLVKGYRAPLEKTPSLIKYYCICIMVQ